MTIPFTLSPRLTLGVEVELQLLDPRTHDLGPFAPSLFERIGESKRIKPEIFQSMVEINTEICESAADVRRDLAESIAALRAQAAEIGFLLGASGSHPFASWEERVPYPSERYEMLMDRNRWIARRLAIFGLHVHVGVRDGRHAVGMINRLLPWLPHLLALSANSPFWRGHDTGLASSRATVFEAQPTAGHPCVIASWSEFEAYFEAAKACRAITGIKDIWWDIRPQPDYGTIELRICDVPSTLTEIVALVALVHAMAHHSDRELRKKNVFRPQTDWVTRENKWRALRWGLDAECVLDAAGAHRPMREDLAAILAKLDPIARDLGTQPEFDVIRHVVEAGPGCVRQRAEFAATGSSEAVARRIVADFEGDCWRRATAPAPPRS